MDFLGDSVVKKTNKQTIPASAGDADSILGQENPLEKEIATHSNILAWRAPWIEKPDRLQKNQIQLSN